MRTGEDCGNGAMVLDGRVGIGLCKMAIQSTVSQLVDGQMGDKGHSVYNGDQGGKWICCDERLYGAAVGYSEFPGYVHRFYFRDFIFVDGRNGVAPE